MPLGVHLRDCPLTQGGACIVHQALQWKRAQVARYEQRPVGEGAIGRDELDLCELRRQLLQRQRRLEGRDSTTADHDLGHRAESWALDAGLPSARPLIGLRVFRS